jgi:hypothetical protein
LLIWRGGDDLYEAIVGSSNFYERVTDGVLAWQEQRRLAAAFAGRGR